MALPPPFRAHLVSARTLTPSVRELTFERTDGRPMEFAPGQWINVLLPEALHTAPAALPDITKRSYSIASRPDGTPRFDIAVTRVKGGPASTWLHALEPGAEVELVGPHGFFVRPAEGPPSLLVATGTGVTPMRSMLATAVAAGARAPMWLLLGVRHEEDLLYAEEMRALVEAHPFVRFEPTLSQPGEGWSGRTGYVQTHVPALWAELSALGAGEPHAYVCGLQRMVGSTRELLRKQLGVERQRVHGERYD